MPTTRLKALVPESHGHIDGLCALYSVLNACKLLFEHSERTDGILFRHLCERTIPDLFPGVMYHGAQVDGLRRLLDGAGGWVRSFHHRDIVSSAPVWRKRFDTAGACFDALRATLEEGDDDGRVLILGLNKPWNHWTVLRRVGRNRAHFFDSWGLPDKRLTKFTLDKSEAGDGPGQKILLDYHQTFLVRLPRRHSVFERSGTPLSAP